jgi:hypothetical protein
MPDHQPIPVDSPHDPIEVWSSEDPDIIGMIVIKRSEEGIDCSLRGKGELPRPVLADVLQGIADQLRKQHAAETGT